MTPLKPCLNRPQFPQTGTESKLTSPGCRIWRLQGVHFLFTNSVKITIRWPSTRPSICAVLSNTSEIPRTAVPRFAVKPAPFTTKSLIRITVSPCTNLAPLKSQCKMGAASSVHSCTWAGNIMPTRAPAAHPSSMLSSLRQTANCTASTPDHAAPTGQRQCPNGDFVHRP